MKYYKVEFVTRKGDIISIEEDGDFLHKEISRGRLAELYKYGYILVTWSDTNSTIYVTDTRPILDTFSDIYIKVSRAARRHLLLENLV